MYRFAVNTLQRRTRSLLRRGTVTSNGLFKNVSRSTSSTNVTNQKTQSLPEETRVVICGGGAVGASVAYHLAERGWSDVVLLEQGRLSGGTTWHAAGLISRIRLRPEEMRMVDYSRHLYEQLDKADYGTGWRECGSLIVARTQDRHIEQRKQHDLTKAIGFETHMVGVEDIKRLCPVLHTDDLVGGIWIPQDGLVNPTDVTMVLTKVAKENGIKVFEGVTVEQVLTENGKVTSVKTSHGDIKCDIIVNCAGQWARDLGKKTFPKTVAAPLYSCEHFAVITKPMKEIDRTMPVVRDYDGHIYIREWNGGILAGGFEPNPKTCFHDGIPDKFEFQLFPEDWDQIQVLMDNVMHRLPCMATAEIRQMINGPESFTPDGFWLVGACPEVKNYYMGAGMNSKGIAGAACVGKYLAQLIVGGPTSNANYWQYDLRRFHNNHSNEKFLRERIPEALTHFGEIKYPIHEFQDGRNLRCSPLHKTLEIEGATFGERMTYEIPLFFATPKDTTRDANWMRTWAKPSWFDAVRDEYFAAKEQVCITDVSSFAKFEVKSAGRQATEFLQYLCPHNIDNANGTIVHTSMLNTHGGFESDCTVVKLDTNHYFITSSASQQTRTMSWLKSHLPTDGSVNVTDVTSMYSGIALIGPNAHHLLADVSDGSMTIADLKPMSSTLMHVGYTSGVMAMRFTHTGEDGFLLYVPSECTTHMYNTLMDAGKVHGIRNAGHYALNHLCAENLIADWGSDLDERTTPLECGQTLDTKLYSKMDFLGKAALLAQRQDGIGQRFTQFLLDSAFDVDNAIWPWGGNPIYRNGNFIGLTTTCKYGFSLKKMVCLGFVGVCDENGKVISLQHNIDDWVMDEEAQYEIVIAGARIPAKPKLNQG